MSVPLRIEEYKPAIAPAHPVKHRRRVSRAARRAVGVALISVSLLVVCLAAVGAMTLWSGISAHEDLSLVGSASSGKLSALMGSAARSNGYVTVSGMVSNVGASHAKNVEAVVELLDNEHRTVRVEQAIIAFKSLPAGESSPFSVIVPDDKHASAYRISFRQPDGQTIE